MSMENSKLLDDYFKMVAMPPTPTMPYPGGYASPILYQPPGSYFNPPAFDVSYNPTMIFIKKDPKEVDEFVKKYALDIYNKDQIRTLNLCDILSKCDESESTLSNLDVARNRNEEKYEICMTVMINGKERNLSARFYEKLDSTEVCDFHELESMFKNEDHFFMTFPVLVDSNDIYYIKLIKYSGQSYLLVTNDRVAMSKYKMENEGDNKNDVLVFAMELNKSEVDNMFMFIKSMFDSNKISTITESLF